MKYTLVVGPTLIPTDGMIFEGSSYLLDLAGIHVDEYAGYTESERSVISPWKAPTHIIILGTPWLWDRCYESTKYKGLQALFNKFPKAKKLFLGIGACLPLEKIEEIKSSLIENKEKLTIFDQATIIVRDTISYDILKDHNPELLPCPAFYAMLENPKSERNNYPVIFWYDPTVGLSNVDYGKDSTLLSKYINDFQTEYWYRGGKVYCINPNERELAMKIGLPDPEVIRGVTRAKLILRNAKSVFSGRVHMAVPAWAINKPATLIAVDSRYKVLEEVATNLIITPKEAIKSYIDILNTFYV